MTHDAAATREGDGGGGGRAPPTAYVVALLFLINVINFLDRQLPSILAQSIKADLGLRDTQLGLLGGLSFALFYGTLALPLARLSDRWSAKWVLTGSLLIWSALTAAGGFAQTFVQLAAARIGVAVGEAGSTPAAHAIISASVSAPRRGLAMGVFSLGVPVGVMAGLILGGWLNDLHSWRFAMLVMGAPGIVVALLFATTTRDRRPPATVAGAATFLETAGFLLRLRSYRHLCIGIMVFGIGIYASFNVTPAFLIRTYGISTAHAGLMLGLVNGLAGGIGAFGGGWLGERLGRGNPGRTLMLPAIGFALASPFLFAALFSPTVGLAIGFMVVPHLTNVMYVAPCFGVAQSLAPPGMRAMASAILLLGLSLVGASVGPYLAGLVSDLLQPRFGVMSLRYALCIACVTNVWAAGHLWYAARALPGDLERLRTPMG